MSKVFQRAECSSEQSVSCVEKQNVSRSKMLQRVKCVFEANCSGEQSFHEPTTKKTLLRIKVFQGVMIILAE